MKPGELSIRVGYLISLLGFLLLMSCLETIEELSPFPDIRFDKTVYNFKKVSQGTKVEYTYEFKNAGIDTLRVTKVRKGCGCQSAKTTRDVIPPREKGGINVVFNSRGYSGVVTKTVYVHSNDPEEPRVALVMKGTVVVDLVVRPRALHFGDVPLGESRSKKIHIVAQNLETLEIKNLEVSADYIAVSTSDYVELNKKGVEIDVTLGPDAPAARIEENIRISTNSKQQPLIQISIHARVFEPATIVPEMIHFEVNAGASSKYTIFVYKADRGDFRITKIRDDIEDIETEIRLVGEIGEKQNYEIEITAKPTASPGSLEGSFTLHTNDSQQSKIKMEVSGVIE